MLGESSVSTLDTYDSDPRKPEARSREQVDRSSRDAKSDLDIRDRGRRAKTA